VVGLGVPSWNARVWVGSSILTSASLRSTLETFFVVVTVLSPRNRQLIPKGGRGRARGKRENLSHREDLRGTVMNAGTPCTLHTWGPVSEAHALYTRQGARVQAHDNPMPSEVCGVSGRRGATALPSIPSVNPCVEQAGY
jgi:hypothetical protein